MKNYLPFGSFLIYSSFYSVLYSGQPSFTETVIDNSADGAWSVYVADIDNDGDVDILSASAVDDKIAW